MIDELLKALELKDERRTGQQLYNIDDPDSVAAHSWGVSLLSIIYGTGEDINMEKVLKMAAVHDLAESRTGDYASRARREDQEITDEEKESKEHDAITDISEELMTHEIRMLWKEYHKGESPEARLVKDMDKIEACLTALKNEVEEKYDKKSNSDMPFEDLDEFFENAEGSFKTGFGKELFEEIRSRYEAEKE